MVHRHYCQLGILLQAQPGHRIIRMAWVATCWICITLDQRPPLLSFIAMVLRAPAKVRKTEQIAKKQANVDETLKMSAVEKLKCSPRLKRIQETLLQSRNLLAVFWSSGQLEQKISHLPPPILTKTAAPLESTVVLKYWCTKKYWSASTTSGERPTRPLTSPTVADRLTERGGGVFSVSLRSLHYTHLDFGSPWLKLSTFDHTLVPFLLERLVSFGITSQFDVLSQKCIGLCQCIWYVNDKYRVYM